jgi:hypothetical protein
MTRPIELSPRQWVKLKQRLAQDYPPSDLYMRIGGKTKLGFTARQYQDWDQNMGKFGGWRKNCIMLDFDSEQKRTFFILKYADYIGKESVNDNF